MFISDAMWTKLFRQVQALLGHTHAYEELTDKPDLGALSVTTVVSSESTISTSLDEILAVEVAL
ncbi:MAG: hypothetical protein H7831_10165 [Magnetococcus sp. WYHC-3]